MRSVRRPVYLVLIAGAMVHAGVLAAAHWRSGRIDGYAFNSLDSGEYYQLARNLAEHGAFSASEAPPLEPDTWRTPGYPLFLAVAMSVLGDSPARLVLVQQTLSVLNAVLLLGIAKTWMSQRRATVVALLFLVEPYHLFYSLWLMSTTLFVTVLLLTWIAWRRALQTGRWPWAACVAVLSAFGVLVRPLAGLVPIVLLAGFIVTALRGRPTHSTLQETIRRWLPVPVFAVSCSLVLGGWMMRNHRVAGHFALSDQGGVVLAYFKATEVVLWQQGRAHDRYLETSLDPARAQQPHTVWEAIDERLRDKFPSLPDDRRASLRWRNLAQGNRTTVDSFAVSEALSGIGWSYLTASPLRTAICYLVRCGSILTFPLNLALKPPSGMETDRLKSAAKGGVYLLFCLCVLLRVVRGRLTFGQVYYPLSCTIALLVATTPQIDPRFRVPMIPLLIVVALLPTPATPSSTG